MREGKEEGGKVVITRGKFCLPGRRHEWVGGREKEAGPDGGNGVSTQREGKGKARGGLQGGVRRGMKRGWREGERRTAMVEGTRE